MLGSRRAAPAMQRRMWSALALHSAALATAQIATAASPAAFSTLARSSVSRLSSSAACSLRRLMHSSAASAASSEDRLQAMMARVRHERESQRLAGSIVPALRDLIQQGQFARVVQIVEMEVSQDVAHDTRVAELYWVAKDAMEQQQQQHQQPPPPPQPAYTQQQHSSPARSSSSSIHTDDASSSSPVLYMRRVGLDPAAGFSMFLRRAFIGGPFAAADHYSQLGMMLALSIVGLYVAYKYIPKDYFSKVYAAHAMRSTSTRASTRWPCSCFSSVFMLGLLPCVCACAPALSRSLQGRLGEGFGSSSREEVHDSDRSYHEIEGRLRLR